MANFWFVHISGREQGPFTDAQLKKFAAAGKIKPDTPIKKGQAARSWAKASQVKGLFETPAEKISSFVTTRKAEVMPSPSEIDDWLAERDVKSEQWRERTIVFSSSADQPANALPPPSRPQIDQLLKTCPYCGEEILAAAKKCKYCSSDLQKGTETETIIWQGHPSGLHYLVSWILGIVLFPFGLIWIIWAILDRQTRVFTYTNRRVMSKVGIISRRIDEVNLRDIRSIGMSQSFSERLFGLGTVQIGSAGTAAIEVEFSGIKNPAKVRDQIRQYSDHCRGAD